MVDGDSLLDVLKAQALDRFLASFYASARHRPGLAALFALDLQLGAVVRATREPMIAQIKLAWWRERLETLGQAPVPAHPVLQAVANELIGNGIAGPMLAEMEDGWAALLAEPLSAEALETHAGSRGGILFNVAARLVGADVVAAHHAGECWATGDVATKLRDPAAAAMAWRFSRERSAAIRPWALPASLRGLALLARHEARLGRRLPDGRRLLLQARGSLLGF